MAIAQIVKREFSRKTISALAKKGIEIVGVTSIPDSEGSFLNATRAFEISDKGTGKIKTFLELQKIAEE